MKPTFTALGRTAAIMLGTTLAVVASAQTPNKLQPDSTAAYQEHNTTSPASATAAWDKAQKPDSGKTPSAGKGPAPTRPNGLGMDAGAGSMSKKQ